MDRRSFLTAVGVSIFVPKFGRWYRPLHRRIYQQHTSIVLLDPNGVVLHRASNLPIIKSPAGQKLVTAFMDRCGIVDTIKVGDTTVHKLKYPITVSNGDVVEVNTEWVLQ